MQRSTSPSLRPPSRPAEPETTVTTEQDIRTLNEAYIRSILTGDVAWFGDHLAEEFVCIESDGSLVHRDEFLRSAAHPTTASYHLDEVDVRCYGDVALVRAKGSWTAKNGKAGFSRYVDVYARAGDRWTVVSAQITRPPEMARWAA
jgi:ketosteroid isomerase-like protein